MDADERWRILRLHVEDGIPLAELVRTTAVPRRTLTRWLTRYRAAGYDGLRDAARRDRGTRRTPPDVVQLIEGLARCRIGIADKLAAVLDALVAELERCLVDGPGDK